MKTNFSDPVLCLWGNSIPHFGLLETGSTPKKGIVISMGKKVLIISFSFEQEFDAFEKLTDAGLSPVLWSVKDRGNTTQQDLIRYWEALPEKPEGILMGADVEIGQPFLSIASGLKAISLNCAGYDHLDLEALAKAGVKVCNVARQNYSAVADFAWGQILSLMRRIPEGDRNIRGNRWLGEVAYGSAVSEKTLGIIGLGAVGQAVARRAIGFDMKILVSSTSRKAELAERYRLTYVNREALFRESDILVLCCPANQDTHHLINKDTLAWMKSDAVIINPSRGTLIDTEALIAALQKKRIGGAALDVFETEPLYDSSLFLLPNTLLTPHMGGLADREVRNVAIQSAKHMVELLENPDSSLGLL